MLHECRHIMTNGEKCEAIALRGKPFCYFHTSAHRLISQPPISPTGNFRLPVLEDQAAIQLAVAQVLDALCASRLDARRAGLFLQGIQIAARTMHRSLIPIPSKPVQTVTQSESGDDLAPERRVCEVPSDCVQCAEKATCKDCEPLASKS